MSNQAKLKEIVRKLIKKEVEEASTSSATPGYQTPNAFTGGPNKGKKKKKDISTNSTGYNMVNEGITSAGYSEIGKRGRYLPLAAKELVKALKKQDDREVIKNIEYIYDLSEWMKDTLKNKKYNESVNEKVLGGKDMTSGIDKNTKITFDKRIMNKQLAGKTFVVVKKGINTFNLRPDGSGNERDTKTLDAPTLLKLVKNRTISKIVNSKGKAIHERSVSESINEGYRKAKDQGGARISQAIINNIHAIDELVNKNGKDPKEVMKAFEGPLKNSIKAGIKHKYKPHPKDGGNKSSLSNEAKIKTFQSELKKFQKIADAVASRPSKAAIKRMMEAYRTIWNHKFGAEIALGGKLYNTIIETMNEGRYHDYRNDESMTPKQKIGRSMREIRDSLNELNRLVKMNVRLKNELKVDSQSYWKNTHKALNKISERLVKLANKVGQLQ